MSNLYEEKNNIYKDHLRESLHSILEQLTKIPELHEQGKEDEIASIKNDIMKSLEEHIQELEEEQGPDREIVVERSLFPGYGQIFSEGNRVRLNVIREDEEDKYLAVTYAYSTLKKAYKDVDYRNFTWREFLSENSFVCSIYETQTNNYIGYCRIKNLLKEDWELAIELNPDDCHKGYGTEALSLFMERVHQLTGNRFFRAKVESDNHASQGLMKKLGGYPNGIREDLLYGEELKEFQKKYQYMITDEIRAVAKDFGMNAEDIIGCVLEYCFDMNKLM